MSDGGSGAGAAAEEGTSPETGALLSVLGGAGEEEEASPSAVLRALPLPSAGAGACAARVTNACGAGWGGTPQRWARLTIGTLYRRRQTVAP